MSGNNVLLDTNVLILASRQRINITAILSEFDHFYTSIVTFMEVYAYHFDDPRGKDLTDQLFATIEIVDIDLPLAEQTILYRKNKNKKIKLPDAIILATAKRISATLLSDDWDDFQGIDPSVSVQNIDRFKI